MPGTTLIFLTLTLLSLIWSSTWMVIKIGLETMPPLLSAGWRFLIAFLALYLYAKALRMRFPRDLKTHLFFLMFSVINFFGGYALVYWGEQFINSGLTSVLFSVMPFYVALFSIKLLPSETITLKKIMGITIGFAGIILIFSDQLYLDHPMAVYGMAAVLISPAFSALGTILGKKARQHYHPVILNTFPLLYTAVIFLLASFVFENTSQVEYTGMAVFTLFYLGILGTAIAFVLYFWILKHISAVVMSLITFVTPPMALVWGWLILDEVVTFRLVIGMAIIYSGILVVRGGKKEKRKKKKEKSR